MKVPSTKIPRTERLRLLKSQGHSEASALGKLADMKRGSKAGAKIKGAVAAAYPEEKYPYGLSLTLDHEGLKKVGMKKLPKVGSKHKLMAHAHVRSASHSEHEGSKSPNRDVQLQITHLSVVPHGENDDSGIQDQ